MKKRLFGRLLFILITLLSFTALFYSCDSWMSDDDDFYSEIEAEVKEANADRINVYVRYSATKMGKTTPEGYSTFKVGIPSEISATTETAYGFWRWAAFPTSYITPGDKQYEKLIYEDDETYQETIGVNELSKDIVKFNNPYSSNTKVTIYEDRADIYLVPVVAKRPSVSASIPSNQKENVVRNIGVRINFSKIMDPESFKNEAGDYDKITISEGTTRYNAEGEIELESQDITDHFEPPVFSTSGKMITLRFKDEYASSGYGALTNVRIVIGKDVKDIKGYSMADDYTLEFKVGSNFDNLAPRISELTAGVGSDFKAFDGVYKDIIDGDLSRYSKIELQGASSANANVDNPLYTEKLLAQRITDKINIRVFAEDIVGADGGADPTGSEVDVSMIGIQATCIMDLNGNSVQPSEEYPYTVTPIIVNQYLSNINQSEIQGTYSGITNSYQGTLFTFNVDKLETGTKFADGTVVEEDIPLPDGLYKIDVWAYDSVGNYGLGAGGTYSSKLGNGYASIFVIKDTTCPDAESNSSRIISYTDNAPYKWYNSKTLGAMDIFQDPDNHIEDFGHEKLRSKEGNLKWLFKMTDKTDWADTPEQKTALKKEKGWTTVESIYHITGVALPKEDGPVAISYVVMDDLGNVSKAAKLSSIMYDNTVPTLETPTWVKADGSLALNSSYTEKVTNSILKIPFADNLSGVKRLSVSVKKGNLNVAEPVSAASFAYGATSAVKPSAATTVKVDDKDKATTNNLVIFENKLDDGFIYLKNLKIGGEDGIYTVTVNVYDTALNISEAKSTTIARDTTKPVVVNNSVKVNEIFEATSLEGETKKWLKREVFDEERTPNKASVTFTVNETGSGIRNIKFQEGTVQFTENSVLKVNGKTLVQGTDSSNGDYKLDVAAKTMTLFDSYNPKIYGSAVTVTIENVIFAVKDSPTANVAKITLTDFVENVSEIAKSADIYADSTDPESAKVIILDRNNDNDGYKIDSEVYTANSSKYTDEQTVTVQVTPASSEKEKGAGIKSLKLSGASFTAASKCTIDGVEIAASFSGETVTFAKAVTDTKVLVLKNVLLDTDTNETKKISVTLTDLMEWTGQAKNSNTIILDTTPAVAGSPSWVKADGSLALNSSQSAVVNGSILKVPFTDNLTGVTRVAVSVKRETGAAAVPVQLPMANVSIMYAANASTVPSAAALLEIRDSDITNLSDAKVLPEAQTGGVFYIKGITIGDDDGIYTVTVNLFDVTLNKSVSTSTTIARDTTKPVIRDGEIKVKEIFESVTYEGDRKVWLSKEVYDDNRTANKASISFKVNETGSGIRNIIFDGGSVSYTSESILKVNGVELVKGSSIANADYSLDVASNKITLFDSYNPKIYGENVDITIENVVFQQVNTGIANTADVKVVDFVDNTSLIGKSIDIYADTKNPEVKSVIVTDRSSNSTLYTNELKVNLKVVVEDQITDNSMGVKNLILTNAKFIDSTVVKLVGSGDIEHTLVKGTDYSTSDSIITFTKPFGNLTTIKLENVEITKDTLISENKIISVTAKDLLLWTSVAKAANTICYDNISPVLEKLTWVPTSTNPKGITKSTLLNNQILKIDFTKEVSGVSKVTIKSSFNNVEVSSKSFEATSDIVVTYKAKNSQTEQTLVRNTDYTLSDNVLTFTSPKYSGTIGIKGLTINESSSTSEGIHNVKVTLTDIAENTDEGSSKVNNISRDITSPVVNKVYVNNILERETYESSEKTYWVAPEDYNDDRKNFVTLTVDINEKGSGVNVVTIGQNAELTEGTEVNISGLSTQPVKGVDYNVDTVNNKITFVNYDSNKTIFLRNTGTSRTFEISKVYLNNENSADGNAVEVKLTDFVTNTGNNKSGADYVLYYNSTKTYTKAFVDTKDPVVTLVEVSDISSGSKKYSNELKLNLKLVANDNDAVSPSGISQFTLTNARFTDTSVIKLVNAGAGDTVLVKNTHYTISGSTITFVKPLTSTVTMKFENIELTQTPSVLGDKIVSVTAKDYLNWISTAKASNTFCYDNAAPVVSALSWTASIGYAGYASDKLLTTQVLNVPFTETPAGVEEFKLEIIQPDGETVYATPFKASGFALDYTPADGEKKTLVSGTDYSVSGNIIKLKTPLMSGTFNLKNLSIADTNIDGTYKVKISFIDYAENTNANSVKQITVNNDTTSPVVEKIEIPELKYSKDITDSTSHSYWLDKTYIGGTGNADYAATAVPVYITIDEAVAGVQLITLGGTMQLQSTSTLWTVAADGTETAVDSSVYEIDTTAKTIRVPAVANAFRNNGDEHIKLLIKNMKFVSGVNTVSVKVKDLSLNDSAENTTISRKEDGTNSVNFYSDSVAPKFAATEAAVLVDRIVEAGVAATAGYTNESTVTLKVKLASESSASGHYKITLNGASFTPSTVITYGASNTEISSTIWHLADSNKSVVFENAGTYYVFHNATNLTFKNVALDNGTTDGGHIVTVTSTDLSGWTSSNSPTVGIILDTTKPTWRYAQGTFAAEKECDSPYDYINNIYPHPNGESAYGIPSPSNEKNKDNETVLYYYTSAKFNNTYGVVVGIGGKDENLYGYEKANGVPYIICDTTDVSLSSVDAAYVAQHGSIHTKDINDNTTGTGNHSGWKKELNGWEFMEAGHTYSIVILDEAGNYSEKAKTVKIVKDTTQPALTYNGTDSLGNLIWLEADGKVFRNITRSQHKVKSRNEANSTYEMCPNNFDYPSVYTYDYVIKKGRYEITINLGKSVAGKKQLDGSSLTPAAKYSESVATSTSSPLEMYAISHRYRQWPDERDPITYPFIPAFPEGTVSPDGTNLFDLFGCEQTPGDDEHQFTSEVLWRKYEKGYSYTDDKISHKVDDNGNIVITLPTDTLGVCPPLTLLLKDGTGNLNYIHIKPVSMEASGCNAVSWVVDDHIGEGKSGNATDGSNRNVGMNTYMSATRNATYNPYTSVSPKPVNVDGTFKGAGYYWGPKTSSYKGAYGSYTGTVLGVQARDLKEKITYYSENAYLGLYHTSESCLFSDNEYSSTISDGDQYTTRIRVRAWNATGPAPEPSDFEGDGGDGTDFTSWLYLRSNGNSTNNEYVLQYPHPSRTEKYRLYYYIEDAAGNYEINTVVNSDDDSMLYWRYDNAGPSIKTRSGDNPSTLTGADINKLVATNNGFRPYYKSGTGYVVRTSTLRTGNSLPNKASLGNGIVLGCIGGEDRKYGSYFDLDITETSGIRAFRYTTTAATPALPSGHVNLSESTMGDGTNWYAGITTAAGMYADRDIGSDMPAAYKPYVLEYLYSKNGNTSYDYYDSSYGNKKYSGVKVVATIPQDLVGSTPTDLYLHVMDWVGNVTTVKLGSGIKWVIDDISPVNDGNSNTSIHNEDHYIASNGNTHALKYTYAATKIPTGATSLKIYMPSSKYTDASSGIYGWSLTANDVTSVRTDANGSYFLLDSTQISNIRSATSTGTGELTVYVYDNVGNCPAVKVTVVGDKTPVPFTMNVRGTNSAGTANGSFVVDTMHYIAGTAGNGNNLLGAEATSTQKTIQDEVDSINSVAYTKDGYVVFLPCFGAYDATSHSDYYKTVISRWNGSAWTVVDSSSTDSLNSWIHTSKHTDNQRYYTTTTYTLDSSKPYYQFAVYDNAGNVNYSYAMVKKDSEVPVVSFSNITNVNSIESKNYYGATATVDINISDDSGVASYKINSTQYTHEEYTPEAVKTNYKLSNFSTVTSSHAMRITDVIDNLEQKLTQSDSISNSSYWIYDNTVPSLTYGYSNSSLIGNKYYQQSNNAGSSATGFKITSPSLSDENDWVSATISISKKTGGELVVSVSDTVESFEFYPKASDTNFYGWIESSESSLSENYIASDDERLNTTGVFTINWNKADRVKYYYPVDKAGNIGSPLKFSAKVAVVPVIEKVEYNNIVKDGSSANYFGPKSSLKVILSSEITLTGWTINVKNSNKTVTGTWASGTTDYVISLDATDLKDLSNKGLNLIVSSDVADSRNCELKGNANKNSWTYDGTGPVFNSISVTGYKDSETGFGYNTDYSIYYGNETDKLVIIPSATDAQTKVGLHETPYSLDGTNWVTGPIEITTLSTGSKYIYVRDKLGNETKKLITLSKDSTNPIISSITDNISADSKLNRVDNKVYFAEGAGSVKFTVNSTATDIRGYRLGADGTLQTSGEFTLNPEDGKTNIFYIIDKVGNVSEESSITFKADNSIETPAVSSISFENASDATQSSDYYSGTGTSYFYNADKISKAVVTPVAITEDSGTVKFGYSTSSSTNPAVWVNSGNAVTISLDTANSSYYLWAKDAVGNTSKTNITLKADNDNPTIEVKPSSAFTYVNSSTDTAVITNSGTAMTSGLTYYSTAASLGLNFKLGDTTSGVGELSDGTSIAVTDNAASTTLSAGSPVTYTVKDKVGHTAKFEITLIKDVSAPVITVTSIDADTDYSIYTAGGVNYYNKASVTVTASDDVHITGYAISRSDSEAPADYDASGTFTLPESGSGAIYLWAKDVLGNVTATGVALKNSTYTANAWTYDGTGPALAGDLTVTFKNGDDAVTGKSVYSETDKCYYIGDGITSINVTGSISDAGAGLPVDYLCYSSNGGTTKTALASEVIIDVSTLTTGTTGTYDIFAADGVGNYTKLGTVKLKRHVTAPGIGETLKPAYSGLKEMPKYKGNNITGFKSGHALSTDSAVQVTDTGTPIYTWKNGEPDKLGTTSNYSTRKLTSGTTFTFPVTGLPTNNVYCVLTYNSIVEPSEWGDAYEVNGNKISGVAVDVSKLDKKFMFIFAWFKDEVGNISVYNVTYPKATDENWWTSDSGKDNNNVSTAEDDTKGTFTITTSDATPLGNKVRITSFVASATSTVKSIFTPKTKSIDLTQNTYRVEKENKTKVISTDTQTERNNNQITSVIKPKKQPAKNKQLTGSGAASEIVSSVSNVLPSDAKVMEATPISEVSAVSKALELSVSSEIDEADFSEVSNVSAGISRSSVIKLILAILVLAGLTLVITKFMIKKS